MRKNTFRMKVVGLLATGAMMMQFGGSCLYDGFLKQVGIGFGRGIGEIPSEIVNSLVAPLIVEIIPTGDEAP